MKTPQNEGRDAHVLEFKLVHAPHGFHMSSPTALIINNNQWLQIKQLCLSNYTDVQATFSSSEPNLTRGKNPQPVPGLRGLCHHSGLKAEQRQVFSRNF